MLTLQKKSVLTVLFETAKGSILQDDLRHQFILNFKDKHTSFKVQEFIQFKKCIDEIDLQDLFLGDGPGVDVQIIHQKTSDHLFVLSLCELVAIKELLHGAMTMLELHRIVSDKLQPLTF